MAAAAPSRVSREQMLAMLDAAPGWVLGLNRAGVGSDCPARLGVLHGGGAMEERRVMQ